MATVRAAMLVAAIVALAREIRALDLSRVAQQLRAYGPSHLILGLAATAGSFLVLGVIEVLAVRAGLRPRCVSIPRAIGTSFVANALSQSIGLSILTGAMVRSRAYARDGIDAAAVARITAFVTITATLGLMVASGIALIVLPPHAVIGRFSLATKPLGLVVLLPAVAYVMWSVLGRSARVARGRWTLERPSPAIAMAQVTLSLADWCLAATALFAFMPAGPGFGFLAVLGAYIVAQLLAVTSHVPAGAGVFEVSVLALLAGNSGTANRAGIAAALVMFRLVYYVAPLILGTVAACAAELHMRAKARSVEAGRGGPMNAAVPYAG